MRSLYTYVTSKCVLLIRVCVRWRWGWLPSQSTVGFLTSRSNVFRDRERFANFGYTQSRIHTIWAYEISFRTIIIMRDTYKSPLVCVCGVDFNALDVCVYMFFRSLSRSILWKCRDAGVGYWLVTREGLETPSTIADNKPGETQNGMQFCRTLLLNALTLIVFKTPTSDKSVAHLALKFKRCVNHITTKTSVVCGLSWRWSDSF